MNATKYIIARILQSFGIYRKTKRLTDAGEEIHLLRQAEEFLGAHIWQDVEHIEPLHVEYWRLRKMHADQKKLQTQLQDAEEYLNSSHDDRNSIVHQVNEACHDLVRQRDHLIQKAEELVRKREAIYVDAQKVKRSYEGIQMKIRVLREEQGDSVDISEDLEKMKSLKVEFSKFKEERESYGSKIGDVDAEITLLEERITEERKRLRAQASSAYQSIGKANQDMARIANDIQLLENDMVNDYIGVGNYVGQNFYSDAEIAKIAKEHEALIVQMQSLRSSIALNHKLAANAD
ncbi:hypothetical protein [Persicirhabdus sediminis]|uniref:Uncharacterized protein n=1 Tax=Persicirhabdus sediminis TaxID=454144 RepID=A0A8J7SQA3_9BACT|nr:hypothetical protein [Persicirhabdus sediminis]MBK1792873.1 hypothetical protein [Persicirhabdus sediminis]